MIIIPVLGFPGYFISDDGTAWSRWSWPGKNPHPTMSLRRLKASRNSRGYDRVYLYRDRKRHQLLVHQLVLVAFAGPKPEGKQSRHFDDIKQNNSIFNLSWGTCKENAQDAIRNGKHRGHPFKLNSYMVQQIRRRYQEGEPCISLGKLYGVSNSLICAIANRKKWAHVA